MRQEQTTLKLGTTVRDPSGGRYVIEGLLGKGGFGAVYLVSDRRVKQHLFALKEVINPNQRDRERFIFEGELLKRLDHRALPRVHRVFEYDKLRRVYLLMDYIQGRNLEALREEQPDQRFSLPLVLALMAPIVDALIYLHRQDPPVVHRDIKPANIIVPIGADKAMLVDFGSAKEYVADATTSIIRHGSPGYAALEQYGSGTTPRTDIYGLGATFYALLTGTVPTDAITRAAAGKRGDPLVPAHLMVPDVQWAVATAIERAIHIHSDDRFETVEAFWKELTACAPQQLVQIPRVTSVDTPQPLPMTEQDALRASKRGAFLPVFLALLLTVTIGMGFLSVVVGYGNPLSALQWIPRPSTPQARVTAPVVSPPSTLTSKPSIYPRLSVSYAGTALDLLNNEKTAIFLIHMQQSQGNIHGFFQGLGLAGSFTGTVTSAGHIQFTMMVYGGNTTLTFEGDIKIGGDIVGSFKVFDQGHFTGEYGLWNVAPSP